MQPAQPLLKILYAEMLAVSYHFPDSTDLAGHHRTGLAGPISVIARVGVSQVFSIFSLRVFCPLRFFLGTVCGPTCA